MGYLAIREAARIAGTTTGLSVDFRDFFERYLRHGAEPGKTPYLKPFGGPFHNRNVAGSYASSSLRQGVAPLLKVASISGIGTTLFNLVPNHTQLAKEHLLGGKRLSLPALAVFLYRDHLFERRLARDGGVEQVFLHDFGMDAREKARLFGASFAFKGSLFS